MILEAFLLIAKAIWPLPVVLLTAKFAVHFCQRWRSLNK